MVQRNLLILALGCAAIALGDGVPGNAALAATTVTISASSARQVEGTSILNWLASDPRMRVSGSGKDHILLAQASSGDSPGNSGNAGGGDSPGNSGNAGGGGGPGNSGSAGGGGGPGSSGSAEGGGGSGSGGSAGGGGGPGSGGSAGGGVGSGSGGSVGGGGSTGSSGAPAGAGASGAGQGGTGSSDGSSGNAGVGGGSSAGSGGPAAAAAAAPAPASAPAPTAAPGNTPEPGQAAPTVAPALVDPLTVGSISGDALPSAIAPSASRNDPSLYRGDQALQAVTQPLPFAPGTPREVVAACRDAIITAARAHGVIHVDASSIGRMEQLRDGDWVAPLEVRIVYARDGGSELKQAPVSCHLSENGNVVSLR